MKRYFVKKDTFFKEGSEAFREDEMFAYGTLFNDDGTPTSSAIYRGKMMNIGMEKTIKTVMKFL